MIIQMNKLCFHDWINWMNKLILKLYSVTSPGRCQAWSPTIYMHTHAQHLVSLPFWFTVENLPPIGAISLLHTLTNSSYRFNTTDSTFSQYHPQTLKMKSYQNLLLPLYLVGVEVQSISNLRHKARSPYNSKIHFPIYTKLVTHVEGLCNMH